MSTACLLKRETRILGLTAPREGHGEWIIGAVFRGSLWLDAVLTYMPEESDERSLPEFASFLKKTKQYPQIQVAIFSRESILQRKYDDYRKLAELVRFPIFAIVSEPVRKLPRTEFIEIRRGKKKIRLWINHHNPQLARELYLLGCTDNQPLPEAVRVAKLVAERTKIRIGK